MTEKPDSEHFQQHLQRLKQEEWLGPARHWWPDYLFHHTYVVKAASILNSGVLLSRFRVESTHPDLLDTASPDIIEQTEDRWNDCVRFYFRPKTPTLYDVEGLRPIGRQPLHAHCPVPVYFLFDLRAIICRPDSLFSDGNLALTRTGRVNVYNSAAAFGQLPFRSIYHDTWFSPEERHEIICRRHAEVVVPGQIGLEHLKIVWCRSHAEFETLRYLLSEAAWETWQDKITARTDYSLFNRRWAYIESVALSSANIRVQFNPCPNRLDRGPFDVRLRVVEKPTGSTFEAHTPNFFFPEQPTIYDINTPKPLDHFAFYFLYANEYLEADDIPF
jgi:hypothetical protein